MVMMTTQRPPWLVRLILFFGFMFGLYLLSLLRVQVPPRDDADPVYIAVKRPIQKTTHYVFPEPNTAPFEELDEKGDEPAVAEVSVHVIDSDGTPIEQAVVAVSGCDERVRRGGPVIPFEFGPDEVCTFRAMRRDGMLTATSTQRTVTLDAGLNTVILELPAERTGGIGVQFEPHEEGMRVVWVMPGTPAYAAGLKAGDIILEVAGVPASTMATQSFIEQMTGPEGSDIDFIIGFESDEGFFEEAVTVTREFLDG